MPIRGRETPALIVLGGPPGVGKTALATRLSAALRIPQLSSDVIGGTIKTSHAVQDHAINSMWIAYDVVFALAEQFLQSGVSVVLDLNLGWAFQWQQLDALRQRQRGVQWLPIVLRCSRDQCWCASATAITPIQPQQRRRTYIAPILISCRSGRIWNTLIGPMCISWTRPGRQMRSTPVFCATLTEPETSR